MAKTTGASSSQERLSHQGRRQKGGIYSLMPDFILVGYICGAGDIYTGTCGKTVTLSSIRMDFSVFFACAGSLTRLLAAAATAASRQTGVYIEVLE